MTVERSGALRKLSDDLHYSVVNDPAGDLFSIALAARCQWAIATCLHPDLTGDDRDFDLYGVAAEDAESFAREAARTFPGAPCPHLLIDVPMLRDAFEHEAALVLAYLASEYEARERCLEEKRQRQIVAEMTKALIASEDWAALDLPTPDELVAKLLDQECVDICGHSLEYEEELDVVWLTNPYGVDGVLCNGRPDTRSIRSFLIDMARGVEYGPVP